MLVTHSSVTNLWGCFESSFIMIGVGNLDVNLDDYFELVFIMTNVDNLDIHLGVF